MRVRLPAPFLISEPVPVMAADEKSVPCARSFERLKASVPLLVMALLADREPMVVPLPIWSVPALIVVAPV